MTARIRRPVGAPNRWTRVPFMPSRLPHMHDTMNKYPDGISISMTPHVGPAVPAAGPALRTVFPGHPWIPVGN